MVDEAAGRRSWGNRSRAATPPPARKLTDGLAEASEATGGGTAARVGGTLRDASGFRERTVRECREEPRDSGGEQEDKAPVEPELGAAL